MINYAALVWWPKTTQKTIQFKYSFLLGITTHLIYIQKQAICGALALSSLKGLKPEDIIGHLKIFGDPNTNHLIHIAKHRFPTQYNLTKW